MPIVMSVVALAIVWALADLWLASMTGRRVSAGKDAGYWHPMAQATGRPGPDGLRPGDRVVYVDADTFRRGWVDEFLQSGTALMTYEDGTYGERPASGLVLESKWDRMMAHERQELRLRFNRGCV